jgi:hypothetical protein
MKRDLGEQKAMEKKFSFSKKRLKKQVGPFFFFLPMDFVVMQETLAASLQT